MGVQSERVDAIVAGAGPGGCVAALLLAGVAREVLVLEQSSDPSGVGAALLLQPNGMAVLEGMGLLDGLRRGAGMVESVRLYAPRGRVLLDTPIPDFGPGLDHALVVRRRDLADALATAMEAAPAIAIERGATVLSASGDGTIAYVAAGSHVSVTASLVVGADGVGSAVRRSGRFDVRRAGSVRRYARTILPGVPDLPGGECWSRLGLIGWAPLGDGTTYLYASVDDPAIRAALSQSSLDEFVAYWSAAAPVAAGLLGRLRSIDELLLNDASAVRCRGFIDDRVVLLGDAAHAMAPNLGQGANSAFVDAVVLAAALATHSDQREALASYDRTRRPAVGKVQRNAERLARLGHLRAPITRAIRDRAVIALGRPALVGRQARAAQQIDPEVLHELVDQVVSRDN